MKRYFQFISSVSLIVVICAIVKLQAIELPADFPLIKVDSVTTPASGFIFMNSISFQSKTVNYNFIIDSVGNVVYYDKKALGAIDFKMQPNGLISYGSPVKLGDKYQAGPITVQNVMVQEIILDSTFKSIDTVQMKNGYLADVHEFLMLPNGNCMLIGYEANPIDMSLILPGGEPNANVVGTVIQELDKDKNCIFQWRSLDFIPLLNTIDNPLKKTFEHVHGNSLFEDTDGNIIASFPTTNEIVKIDRISGNIIWRLGGAHSDFQINNEHSEFAPIYFSMQHDAKRLPNGNLLFYDNGVAKKTWLSRAVEYSIDENNKEASLIWEYRHNPDISAYAMGSVQRLKNGNTLIDWGLIFKGFYKTLTEVNNKNEIVFELSIPSDAYSYRAFKYDLPACKPIADVDQYEMLQGNTYNFKNKNANTGVEIYFKQLDGFIYNMMNVKKYECAPMNPSFDGDTPALLPLRYVIKPTEIKSFAGEMRFDLSTISKLAQPDKMSVFYRKSEGNGSFISLPTSYDSGKNILTAQISDSGEYVIGLLLNKSKLLAPSLLYPWDNKYLSNSRPVLLNWSPTGRYSKFQIQVAKDQNFANIIVDSIVTNTTRLLLSLDDNLEYFWKVKTFYEDIESDWSKIRKFTLNNSFIKILKPENSAVISKDSSYIIRWNTNITDSLRLTLMKNDAEFSIIVDSLLSLTNAYRWSIPSSVPNGDDYKIKIESIKNNHLSIISEQTFSITSGNSIKNFAESNILNISNYPNPMSNSTIFDFSLAKSGKTTLTLLDVLGNVISVIFSEDLEKGNYKYNWNNDNLPSGIYLYKLDVGNSTMFGKLNIIK